MVDFSSGFQLRIRRTVSIDNCGGYDQADKIRLEPDDGKNFIRNISIITI